MLAHFLPNIFITAPEKVKGLLTRNGMVINFKKKIRKFRSEIRKLGENRFKAWNDNWKPQAHEDSKPVFTQQVAGLRQASPLNPTHQICSTCTIYLHRYIRSLCKLWVLAAQKQRKKPLFYKVFYLHGKSCNKQNIWEFPHRFKDLLTSSQSHELKCFCKTLSLFLEHSEIFDSLWDISLT